MAVAAAAALSTAALIAQGRGGFGAPAPLGPPSPLQFRYMGPAAAGRIASVAGVPGDPNTYYLGAASGGVWKSTDAGKTFVPVFDNEPVMAIGALAVAPTDPKQVWAGTGEAWVIRDSDIMGDGIYKSTDGGTSWTHMGLDNTGRIGRVIVDPTNADVVYACAIGRVTGPQQERGVFKTTDGGTTWKRVLFVDPNTGCSGLSIDAHDPNTLVAGMWQVEMHAWGEFSGGPGSGVHITHDGGATWKKVTAGMPKPPVGKIDVAIAPSDSQRIYALIQTADQGSLWRSDDGGETFTDVNWSRGLVGRAGYYIRLGVNPQNADDVHVLNSGYYRSSDGGKTFPDVRGGGGCGDCHDIWIDPKDGNRFVLTDDGGARINSPAGSLNVRLPIGQMYHVAFDDRVPYWIYSNRQDNGTMRGPSTLTDDLGNGKLPPSEIMQPDTGRGGRGGRGEGRGRGGPQLAWQTGLGGCESGFTLPDPKDPDIVWASCYGNEVTRFDNRVGRARSVAPWIHTLDSEPNKAKYRCHWTPPLATDPFDGSVYYGCQVVFKTSDNGQSWKVISPDLSTQDPAKIVSSGGIVGDNLGQFYGEVVFAISPSQIQKGLIWAGTNDGKLWYTKDGGASGQWTDVTKNIPGLPAWATVTEIWPSTFDPGSAYVAFDAHLNDDFKPYIYKTRDWGVTWTKISTSLPTGHPLDYAKSVAENPNKRGMLFAGTGHAFFYSMNDGQSWTHFNNGLPPAPVTWITVEPRYHDVVISTYGRGLYILPDISLFEATGQTTLPEPSSLTLYPVRPGFRQARNGSVEFTYGLPAASAAQAQLQILDSTGQVIRTMNVPGSPGLNRAEWDLHYEAPKVVELRTTPKENPHVWEEPRFKGKDWRPVTHWGIQGAQVAAPIAAPGKYSVRLTVNGQSQTQPFTVLKDPAIPSSDADLVDSTAMQIKVRDDLTLAATLTNKLETMRREIEDARKANAGKASEIKALDDLDAKLLGVELQLITHSDMQSDDKYYPEQYKVYMNLIWFNGGIGNGAGDVSGGAEYKPTDAEVQVLAGIEHDLAAAKADYDKVTSTDVPAFNKAMKGKVEIQ